MIKITAILLTSICFSCSAVSQEHRAVSEPVKSLTEAPKANIHQRPDAVVTEFMKFVSLGDKDKANELLESEVYAAAPANVSPDEVHKGEDAGGRLDWVTVFTERKFRLANIVEEKVEGNKSKLTADLGTTDDAGFRERALFHLSKVNGRWLISDIELLGKPPSSSNRT